MSAEELLKLEMKKCWLYFYDNTNLDKNSNFFGLTRDKYPLAPDVASISATGYSLASLIVAVDNSWLTYEEGYDIAFNTLKTFLYEIKSKKGFYYRYINIETGKREWNSEISIIDTSILMCGILAVGEYFEDEVKKLADMIYSRIDWNWFLDKNKNQFRLGYKNKFYGYWDNYAEQLIIYILASGSPSNFVSGDVYYSFDRRIKNYKDIDNIIYSWFGSLFTYQYSHVWIDFRDLYDENSVNWYNNSLKATLANKKYCLANKKNNRTFEYGYWGISATITKKRYSQRHGAEPCVDQIKIDGTISLSALISSIIFLPDDVKEIIVKLYNEYPNLFDKYGLVTSMNLNGRNPWFSNEYLGIDKGTTMLAISNYFNNNIWELMMNNVYIKNGLKKIKLKKMQ